MEIEGLKVPEHLNVEKSFDNFVFNFKEYDNKKVDVHHDHAECWFTVKKKNLKKFLRGMELIGESVDTIDISGTM